MSAAVDVAPAAAGAASVAPAAPAAAEQDVSAAGVAIAMPAAEPAEPRPTLDSVTCATPPAPGTAVGADGAHNASWRVDYAALKSKLVDPPPAATSPKTTKAQRKGLQHYYEVQKDLVEKFGQLEEQIEARMAGKERPHVEEVTPRSVTFAINLSFVVNVCLFVIKLVAAIYSGSLAVIASAVDSSLDILSGSIIFCATRIAARKNKFKWPVGKTRLEPLAIVVFASVMGMAALQLVIQGINRIIEAVADAPTPIKVDAVSYGVIGAVIVAKSLLLLLCWSLRNASDSAAALAQDHRNDVVTNSVTIIVLALLGKFPSVWWLDPATAMVLGLLILVTWTMTGKGHVQQLSGRVATPDQVAMLTYLAMNHDKRVDFVDTVRAYYVGSKVQVECDIILPKTMPLAEAHDIAESLQHEIERLDFVERAYVHIDTEFDHHEYHEHIVNWR